MKRRASKLLSLALTFGFLSNACSSTAPRRPQGPLEQPIEKEGQKVPGGDTGAAVPPESPSGANIPGLWAVVNNTGVTLSEDDLMKATQLYPTQPNTLEEAVFVVTQMRILRADWERKTSFKTQDLRTQETADYSAGLSLERTFADLQIDLASVIRSNPHLKNLASLKLAKQLLATTKNSDSYRAGLALAIRTTGAQWPELLAEDAPVPDSSNSASVPAEAGLGQTPAPADSQAATQGTPAPQGTVAPQGTAPATNLDLMGSDTLLIAAQKLADKRDYKAALEHVARIKKDDPFYAQAQEKQKQYATRAVKDLRARAAEAFSNATPLNDSRAKVNYLRQAKLYLEQALNDYPMADGLDSVKDNLEAVNRSLESADKSGS